MNSRISSLHLVESACWRELERASHDRDHEWRVMSLATLGTDGGEATAELRLVVLRECSADARQLMFFTDSRSAKVAQLSANPQASLLVWSRRLGWQLRLRCRMTIETSGLAVSSRWARMKMTPGAQDYLSPLPPGTPVERFEPERGTREHFAVVTAQVQVMDWLELHADGHRRAVFGPPEPRWVSP
ncbi:MAG: pyridoxamine 5'-phosphate oxidase family protein [Burkholderiales bacterium]|nr:pyridoxamine 5'-phosphate oxidase family protein [Burkholderiales bacterium]